MSPRALPNIALLHGWGRVGRPGCERLSEDLTALTRGARLTRGLGRSYGDASLPATASDIVVASRFADSVRFFDRESGVLRADAGLSLRALSALTIPSLWFTPVTPGTEFVTLGGMVAADVHGKNHHVAGCFGEHVRSLRLRLADDSIVDCSPSEHSDLFWATVGGMGLTGHILEVELQLSRIPSAWVLMESRRVPDLDAYLVALRDGAAAWPMTVGWIDCLAPGTALGRGLFTAGRWAEPTEAPPTPPRAGMDLRLPVDLPNWAINDVTARAFNILYYWRHFQRVRRGIVGPRPFFYPLDGILEWNRAYGSRGFTQYQCVLPKAAGPEAVRAVVERSQRLGGASPLCVIKDCGPQGHGMLSFPLEGTSVAIDLAARPEIQRIVADLNAIVSDAGGRIYLAKDQFTTAEAFRKMEPRLESFLMIRERFDPTRRLRSALSMRLFGDPPVPE